MKKLLFIVPILALCTIYLLGSKSEGTLDVQTKAKLVMGVSLDYPPFEFVSDGIPQGFDIDLANMLANKLNIDLEIKDMEFNSLLPALNSGQVDFVLSSMSPTVERMNSVDFSENYYTASVSILVLKDKELEPNVSLKGMRVGVQLGSSFEAEAKKKQQNTSFEILSLSRIPALIEELKLGRIDSVLVDSKIAKTVCLQSEHIWSHEMNNFAAGAAIVFPKHSSLTAKFNKALRELSAEGKLSELENKWIN